MRHKVDLVVEIKSLPSPVMAEGSFFCHLVSLLSAVSHTIGIMY